LFSRARDGVRRAGCEAFSDSYAETDRIAHPDAGTISDAQHHSRAFADTQPSGCVADSDRRAQSIGHRRVVYALSFADRLWPEC
jgi:hypothetical protein